MENRTEYLIESYFANNLSEAERAELKSLLAADATAAAEFAWQQRLALQFNKRSLSKGIQNDTWREAAKPPFRRVTMGRTLMAAAAAIGLLAVAYFFLPNLLGGNSEIPVAASFEHFPNKMKFRNLGETTDIISPDVLEAFAEYDKKNYTVAAAKLTQVVNTNPTRSDYRFYLGVAFAGAEKYPETINTMLSVAQDSSSTYSTSARYYLGVAYAGIKDVPQAKKYLQEYIDAQDGVTFRDKAKKLLRRL